MNVRLRASPPPATTWPPALARRTLVVAALALGAGFAITSLALDGERWLARARALLLTIGEAQLAARGAGETRADGVSEYLVVLDDGAAMSGELDFVGRASGIAYAGESIYPRSFRISLDVPVGGPRGALLAREHVAMVLPVTPFLGCH